ncbi:glycosyl transferase [Actinosynnema sp. ALI-1.44]|uniref:glycosyltransferase n=1 Tax=Actinosynnema sp. ALI-1.44 TaxID=1933779 RepID=UPI00097BD08B|nr:glycosyltransferase [Actinosynnema sp. ALI-1.44]ONI79312.1 glycosyl transferase [Actinosynnema sp. ALI-1.44]
MRVVLSTVGSRGEAQPVAALALRLQARGHQVSVCVSPDFRDWFAGMGVPAVAVGPEMRPSASSARWDLSTPEGRVRAAEDAVAAQFATLPDATRECDILVGCGAVQVAARSVAELSGITYVHVEFCPAALPSAHHAPAPWPGWPQDDSGSNTQLWVADAQRWQDAWGPALNKHRAAAGLPPVEDVRDHVLTRRPWLAADPTLSPWPGDADVVQTGAWIMADERPLSRELTDFLAAGAPPVYFGLGSYASARAGGIGQVMVDAARVLGHRAIISRGWADLSLPDATDCLTIGESNHQELFGRVAAVVHHGGAGTTTAAARAGAPQVVIPQQYDQYYWAARVDDLGIGVAHAPGMPTSESLANALATVLQPEVARRAGSVAAAMSANDGTQVAVERLLDLCP